MRTYCLNLSREVVEDIFEREPVDDENDLYGDCFVADEPRPRILDGMYLVQCIDVKEIMYCGAWKLHLRFKVIEGEDSGLELDMFMNMTDSKGKKFTKIPRASNYYKNWVIANSGRTPARNNKMSPRKFKDGIFWAAVRDAKPKFPDGKDMPQTTYYSVISHLVKREA